MCAGDGRMTTRTSVEKSGGALLFRGLGGGWRPPTVCQISRTMNTLVARWEGKRCKGMGERGEEGNKESGFRSKQVVYEREEEARGGGGDPLEESRGQLNYFVGPSLNTGHALMPRMLSICA